MVVLGGGIQRPEDFIFVSTVQAAGNEADFVKYGWRINRDAYCMRSTGALCWPKCTEAERH